MPTAIQAALLGVVQGLTEFLPVSSSAHLILARAFFGFDIDKFGLSFDVACHIGTLVAVLIYFRGEVTQMIASLPRDFQPGPAQAGAYSSGDRYGVRGDQDVRLIWLLVIGTVPAVIVGLLFNKTIENHLRTPHLAALALALGAVGLLIAERATDKTRSDGSLTMTEAFWLGCAQAVALIPGVSRSGVTMTVALLFGLRRPAAARFVFLLAIPAIFAAAADEGVKVLKAGLGADMATLFVIGIATSAIVGYIAVKCFIRYLASHSLDMFAWYRLALAASVVIWLWRA